MEAYIYRAALYCAVCAKSIKVETPLAVRYESWFDDSENYPQGPYPAGGGESDTPNHCDECGTFLENPLTTDGMEYVEAAQEDALVGAVAKMWADFYLA